MIVYVACMTVFVRPCSVETDVEGSAALLSALETEPTSADDMRKWILHVPPGRIVERLVAEKEGLVVGYAVAVHEAWLPEGDFYAWAGVAESHRLDGIGRALWSGIEEFLASQPVTLVRSEVREVFPLAIEFACRRGFVETRRIFESVLDLTEFDEAPFAACRPRLEAGGFRFLSLAGLPEGRGSLERFYRLNSAICREIPGEEMTPTSASMNGSTCW